MSGETTTTALLTAAERAACEAWVQVHPLVHRLDEDSAEVLGRIARRLNYGVAHGMVVALLWADARARKLIAAARAEGVPRPPLIAWRVLSEAYTECMLSREQAEEVRAWLRAADPRTTTTPPAAATRWEDDALARIGARAVRAAVARVSASNPLVVVDGYAIGDAVVARACALAGNVDAVAPEAPRG